MADGAEVQLDISPERSLELIRAIEKLGGSSGYADHLAQTQNLPIPRFPGLLGFTQNVPCTVDLITFFFYSSFQILADDHSATGNAWGSGPPQWGSFRGTFSFNAWEDVTSGENHYTSHGVSETSGLVITFSVKKAVVGQAKVSSMPQFGPRTPSVHFAQGTCVWTGQEA